MVRMIRDTPISMGVVFCTKEWHKHVVEHKDIPYFSCYNVDNKINQNKPKGDNIMKLIQKLIIEMKENKVAVVFASLTIIVFAIGLQVS